MLDRPSEEITFGLVLGQIELVFLLAALTYMVENDSAMTVGEQNKAYTMIKDFRQMLEENEDNHAS